MWCPRCRSEFLEGFTRCATCGVDLVERLPSESQKSPGVGRRPPGNVSFLESVRASEDRDRFVSVFEGTQAQAIAVRRRLEAALIPADLWRRRDSEDARGDEDAGVDEDAGGDHDAEVARHEDLVRVEVPLSYVDEARAIVGRGVPEAPEPLSLGLPDAEPLAASRSGMPLVSWLLIGVAVLIVVALVLSR